jgi:regulatory protein
MMAFAKPKRVLDQAGLMEYALKSLASRMRSVRDLRRLMKMRAEPGAPGEAAMDAVIARLTELNYLNDPRFAADYTRLRKENEKHGRRRVQQDLMQKGVGGELVKQALAAAYDDEDEAALVRAYIARKRMREPKDDKERARGMGRLLRAGFSSSAIYKVMRSWGGASEEQLSSLDDAAAEIDGQAES